MKVIEYDLRTEIDHGTEEMPRMEEIRFPVVIVCQTRDIYEANYPIAEKEAVPGTILVSGAFDGEDIA